MKDSKRLRSFYCSDQLWSAVEDEADARGLTVDQLVSDILESYLQQLGDLSGTETRRLEDMLFAAARSSLERGLEENDALTSRLRGTASQVDLPGEVTREAPPRRSAASVPPQVPGERPRLSVIFAGQRAPVTKERFVIGRASQNTDLQIRDANVSRRHAAVIFHDGAWYIHDLQSTNGVEFRGRKIHTRRIEHGDCYTISDYQLSFEFED